MSPEERIWMDMYNTSLVPEEEQAFQKWLFAESVAKQRDLSMDLIDYDLRGYWKDVKGGKTPAGHGPDTFKKPNHPTFSNESIYHGTQSPWGFKFEGGKWGKGQFTPSKTMLKVTHPRGFLQDYFKRVEPGVELILPESEE